MAGPRIVVGAMAISFALASLALTGLAVAQSVPLPQPAPPRPSAPIPLSPGAMPTPQTNNPISRAPAIRPPAQFKPGQTIAIDAKQRILVDKVSSYLSGIRTLTGNFVQVGPDGSKSEGDFYIQKPGRVRFDYNPPNPIELIADGSSVVVRDRKLATQDLYPLSQTPLRFLLADNLDLTRDTNLIGVYADDVFVTVVIEERQIFGGTHRLMLMFSAHDLQLKQWTITDPQGYDTTVAVYNLNTSKKPDPGLFRIDYTRNIQ